MAETRFDIEKLQDLSASRILANTVMGKDVIIEIKNAVEASLATGGLQDSDSERIIKQAIELIMTNPDILMLGGAEGITDEQVRELRRYAWWYHKLKKVGLGGNPISTFNRIQRYSQDTKLNMLSLITLVMYAKLVQNNIDDFNKFAKPVTELHIPESSNFNGRGTKVKRRLDFTFKKLEGIGTFPYHIPTDISDLLAFIHDLAYYTENNYDRAVADYSYYYNAQNIYPFLYELSKYGLIEPQVALKAGRDYSDSFSGNMLGLASLFRWIGLPEQVKDLTSPLTVAYRLALPYLGKTLYNFLPFNRYKSMVLTAPEMALGLLPDWFKIADKIETNVRRKLFGEMPEFNKRHNEVVESALKYFANVAYINDKGVFTMKNNPMTEDTMELFKDYINKFNSMVEKSDYPTQTIEIDYEDPDIITQIVSPVRTEEVKPAGISPSVLVSWFKGLQEVKITDEDYEYKDKDKVDISGIKIKDELRGSQPQLLIAPPEKEKIDLGGGIFNPNFIKLYNDINPYNLTSTESDNDKIKVLTNDEGEDITVEIQPTSGGTGQLIFSPDDIITPPTTTTTTPTTTTTTATTTTTTTTPTTITITEEDLGKFPMASLQSDIEPIAKEGEEETIVISAEDLNV